MTIGSVNPFLAESPAAAVPARAAADGGDFAAVARAVAAGNLDAAQAALGASAPVGASTATLSATLAEGNLAAARLALAQLGTDPFASGRADVQATRSGSASIPGNAIPPLYTPPASPIPPTAGIARRPPTDNTIAGGAGVVTTGGGVGPPAGFMVADVGATIAAAGSAATGATATQAGGPVAHNANGGSYDVADIMLALATGNAGTIPADLINRYGPGGALYDPAAIMDAYRSSTIGQVQMAQERWIGPTGLTR